MMVLSEKDLCGLQSPVGAVLSQKCAGEVRLGQSPEPFLTDSQSGIQRFWGGGRNRPSSHNQNFIRRNGPKPVPFLFYAVG